MGRDPLDQAGYLYGLIHPAHPGYVKVGKARNYKKRLINYNTGCPHRAYAYAFVLAVPRYHEAEIIAHNALYGLHANGEWFKIDHTDALYLLINLPNLECQLCPL